MVGKCPNECLTCGEDAPVAQVLRRAEILHSVRKQSRYLSFGIVPELTVNRGKIIVISFQKSSPVMTSFRISIASSPEEKLNREVSTFSLLLFVTRLP